MRVFRIEEDGKFREYVEKPFKVGHEEVVLERWLEKVEGTIRAHGLDEADGTKRDLNEYQLFCREKRLEGPSLAEAAACWRERGGRPRTDESGLRDQNRMRAEPQR